MPTRKPTIILASSSPYRRELLSRIGIAAQCHAPDIDETPFDNEAPAALAARLAIAKAQHIAQHHSNALIIGSDQVAELDGQPLGKPGSRARAIAQLQACSGKTLVFHSGLCLINSNNQRQQHCVERFAASFRTLSQQQIQRYVDREPALDCAGSFKMEGLGISLFRSLNGRDPNSLIGLPLIRLIDFLEAENYPIP